MLAVVSAGAALLAFNARNDALAARQQAVLQREATEAAQDLTIAAADDFIVDLATKLRASVGVPRRDVEKLFDRAEAFLSEVEAEIDDPTRLNALRAALLLEQAGYALDKDETEDVVDLAKQADALIRDRVGEGTHSAKEVNLRLSAADYLVWNARNQDDKEEAARLQTTNEAFLEANKAALSPSDQQYWDAVLLSRLYWLTSEEEDWERAEQQARQCLDILDAVEEPEIQHFRTASDCTHRWVWVSNEQGKATEGPIEALKAAMGRIPVGEKSRGDWHDWIRATGLMASVAGDGGDFETALSLNKTIRARLERLAAVEPEESGWRIQLAYAELDHGYILSNLERPEDALDASFAALSHFRDIKHTFPAKPDRAESYLTVLKNLGIMSENVGLDELTPERLETLETAHRDRIETTEFLVDLGREADCEGCTFAMHADILAVHAARFAKGELAAGQDMLDSYDRLLEVVQDHLDEDRDDLVAVNAREAYAVMSTNLAAFMPRARGQIPAEGHLPLLAETEDRLAAYLNVFPRDMVVKVNSGDALLAAAKLHLELGETEEAADAAHAAVDRGSYAAAIALADWYRTGTGPVAQDEDTALDLDIRVAKMSPVLRAPLAGRWLGEPEADPILRLIPVFLPSDESTAAVDEVIWRAKTLGAIELAPGEAEKLHELFEQAQSSETPFPFHASAQLSGTSMTEVYSPGQLVDGFYERLEQYPDEEELVLNVVQQLVAAGGGEEFRPNAIAALRIILRDRDHPKRDAAMTQVADLIGLLSVIRHIEPSDNLDTQAIEAFLEEILNLLAAEFPSMDPKDVAKLLAHRGAFLQELGDEEERLEGFSLSNAALALDPSSYEAWAGAGDSWLEDDLLQGLSPRLLARAEELVEQGSLYHGYVLGSLGWSLILNDRADEGLEKLQEAVPLIEDRSAREGLYRSMYEAHRRMGRLPEARSAIVQALGGFHIGDDIDEVRVAVNAIHEDWSYADDERDAAHQIAALLVNSKPDPLRVSVDEAGVAIRGFDPVSYRQASGPLPGDIRHFAQHDGAIWLFSSAENRDRFIADPETYAPAFGGFYISAMFAMLGGREHPAPYAWHFFDDRLYLFNGESTAEAMDQVDPSQRRRIRDLWATDKREWKMDPSPPSIYEPLILEAIAELDPA